MKAQYRSLPIEALVDGMRAAALVDTSCITILLSPKLVHGYGGKGTTVKVVDRMKVNCRGSQQVELQLCGMKLTIEVIIIDRIINGINIVGIDVISKLWGLVVKKMMRLSLERCIMLQLSKSQTVAELMTKISKSFDHEKWTVEWHWKGEPPVLQNKMNSTGIPGRTKRV